MRYNTDFFFFFCRMRHIKFTYVQNLQTKLINKAHRHTQNKQMETMNKSKNYD